VEEIEKSFHSGNKRSLPNATDAKEVAVWRGD
jgi:hypothetical protein